MIKPRDIHETTDYEFEFLDDGQTAVLTLRTDNAADHSFLLSREIVERLSVEIAHKLCDELPPAGGQ